MTDPTAPTETGSSGRYLDPHQARGGPPRAFEDALGDSIEEAYGVGIHDLDGLVRHLEENGPPPEAGGSWTPERFTELMKELGA